MRNIRLAALFLTALLTRGALAAGNPHDAPTLAQRPDSWYATDEAKTCIDNIISWQGKGVGGVQAWPKAYNSLQPRPADGSGVEWGGIASIDNGATYSELKILAKAITFEKPGERQQRLTDSFNKGLDAVLSQQYANGGWPQRFPPGLPNQAAYNVAITFNDDAMTEVMAQLQEIAAGNSPYAFVDEDRRKKSKVAWEKGLDCILKCQIVVNGKLTGWCAQHDKDTFKAVGARAFELAGISGEEGATLAVFLMHIEKPDDRVKKAVVGAAEWFDSAKIVGKAVTTVNDPNTGRDRVLVDSPGSVIWARFYDLETGKPFFSGGGNIKSNTMAEINQERRTGYAWYGTWGAKVLAEYPEWKKRNGM